MAKRSDYRDREERAEQKRHHNYHFLDRRNPDNIDMGEPAQGDFWPREK